jgi:hypothetical protein
VLALVALVGCGSQSPGLPDGRSAADGSSVDGSPGADGPSADGTSADGPSADGTTPADAANPDAVNAACATALLYNDCDPALNANCFSIPQALWSDDAAARLGIATRYGGVHDQAAFRTLFDAGGFEVIVFESSVFDIDTATASRLETWVQSGGKIVFNFWDLDGVNDLSGAASANATVATTLRAALEVSTTGSFTTPNSVFSDAGAPVDFFDRVEAFPDGAALGFSNPVIDDGDSLALSAGGFLAGRFMSTTGPGAIAVTRSGRAVVLGFLPVELVYQILQDADTDGIPDVEELYTNAIGYLCGS